MSNNTPRKSMVRNSLYNVVYTAVKLVFPLVTSTYVARILSVEGIGKVTTANNLVSYFTVFAALGIPTYGIREIAKAKGNSTEKNRLFTELLLINAISTLICTAVYLLLVVSIELYSRDLVLYICCGISIVFNFINIDWLYKGSEEYGYITARSLLVKVLSLFFIFVFVRSREDYVAYALVTCLANGANYVFNILHARKYVRLEFHNLHLARHLKPIFILLLGIFFSSIYSKIDITMISVLSGESATAYYSYAHRIVEMALMGCTAISEVFLPRLSYTYRHNRDEFYGILSTGIQILIFLSLPMTVGLILLAPQMITLLFGTDFLPAAGTLRMMSILIVIKSLGDLVCYQLVICTGNEKKRIPAYAMAAVVNVIFNLLLIPRLAQIGAVIASVLSELIVNIAVFIRMRKSMDIPIRSKSVWLGISTSLLMGVAVLGICRIDMPLALQTAAAVLGGAAVYFGVNAWMKNPVLVKLKSAIQKHG